MGEFISSLNIDPHALVFILAVLMALRAFVKAISSNNPIDFWHFYSSRGPDGQQWGDPNKLGIMVGIFASTFIVGYAFYTNKVDNWFIITLFAIWLAFIAGSESFAKWLRSFLDRKVNSVSSTSTVDLTSTTTTTTPPTTP